MANIMIVLDGLEDTTYPMLAGKTPYDFGKGEAFRELEAHSATGRLKTTPEDFEPDTQTCVLTMLGVAPEQIPSGRSCIEALAIGMPVEKDDMVLRCNFVKITPDGRVEDPTCAAPKEVANALLAEVSALPGVNVTQVGSYKSLQRIAGGKEYLAGMVTYPPHNYAGCPLEELLPSGNELADKLADFSRAMLKKYAPYTVYNWAHSVSQGLPAFAELHGGKTGGMVSATHAPMGGAIAMGMACPELPTATGDTDTDLAAKVKATLALLAERDFVMLHVGGPDEATHRQDAKEKAEFVAKMDKELMAPLLAAVPKGTRIMVTCDHMALCTTGGHLSDPVAFWLYEKGGDLSGDLGVREGTEAVEVLFGRV